MKKEELLNGLTLEEVNQRISDGQVNKKEKNKTRTYREILFTNTFTLFNLIILIMASLVIPTIFSSKDVKEVLSDITNLSFVMIALVNLIIGISTEIKAKKVVDKLILVNESKVTAIREGIECLIPSTELVLDDVFIIKAGNEIPADSIVLDGEISVNEANITGESDDIVKKKKANVFSGTYCVSGEAVLKAVKVGKDNFINTLARQASKYEKPNSEIMNSLNLIIKIITLLALPISFLLYKVYSNTEQFSIINPENTRIFGNVTRELVLAIVSGVNGMIPYGLFLLTSVSLLTSVIKLNRSKTLVQDNYCIEQLARVDTLCLDKTGTITDGSMSVEEIMSINASYNVKDIISSMNAVLKGDNMTSEALKKQFGNELIFKPDSYLNFNSKNKYSAVDFGKNGIFVLGAPDVLLELSKDSNEAKLIQNKAKKGYRVLALCKTDSKIVKESVHGSFELISLIVLKDSIRKGALDTIRTFQNNNVTIKVISGDNPLTVSAICKDAGIRNASSYISLDKLTDEEVKEAATKYTVFGRVKPHQKKLLVEALKEQDHKVAMTGDGVNDILALRAADCSIAMASGSEAVKGVAQLVLLDSNFLALPKVVEEGRRVINNVERTASVFLSKSVLMILINVFCIFLYYINPGLQFTSPFREPSQLFIIETFIIGIPTFFLAIESNPKIVKGNFAFNIVKRAVPGAVIVFANIISIRFLGESLGLSSGVEQNVSLILSSLTFYMILIYVCLPLTTTRLVILIVTFITLISIPLLSIYLNITYSVNFFKFVFTANNNIDLSKNGVIVMVVNLVLSIILFGLLGASKIKYREGIENEGV